PCCSRQSVNPPVEAPTSRHILPTTSICQYTSARSSLSPPRLTYLRSSPSRRTTASSSPCAPALSTFWSLTNTLPARMRAWARSREATSRRSTRSLSSLSFKICSDWGAVDGERCSPEVAAQKCQPSLRCKVLKCLALNHLQRYLRVFPQNFPRLC